MFSPSNALEMWIFFSLVWCGASAFTAHSDHTVVRGALSESELVELRQFAASVLGREEWNDVRESDVTSRRRTSDGRRGAVTAVEEASSVLDKWTLPIASELNWEMPFQQEFAHNDLQVCAYASGDFFDRHLDDETRGLSGYKRLTTICMLSDDFEGGDLELNGNLWRLRAGDLAVFEAGSCEHAVLPVASGIRVSLVAGIFWRC